MYNLLIVVLAFFQPFGKNASVGINNSVNTGVYTQEESRYKGIKSTNWHYFYRTLPEKLMDEAVVYANGKIFILGGYSTDSSSSLSSVYIYDFTTETWDTGAPMPVDLCMYDATYLGNTIYIPGGYSYKLTSIIDTLLMYSMSSNTWTTAAGPGDTAWFYRCVAAQGKIFRIGGLNNESGQALNSVWEYDPGSGTWTRKSDIPYRVELMSTWLRNDTIFIAGGYDGSKIINTTAFYDISSDTWVQDSAIFAYLPVGWWGASFATYHDTLYFYGGVDTTWSTVPSTFYYDDNTNSWVELDSIPLPIYRGDGAAIEGMGDYDGVYLFGGSTGGFNPTDTIQTRADGFSNIEEGSYYFGFRKTVISKTLTLNIEQEQASITIFTRDGRIFKKENNVSKGIHRYHTANPGIYFVKVTTKDNTEFYMFLILK